jgi:hypothetical protein
MCKERGKAILDEKEQLRIRIAIIREKYIRIIKKIDRTTPKEVGWLKPPCTQDGLLNI